MLTTNSEYLRCEIMDVLRAFNEEERDMTHYFSYSGGKFYNTVECGGEFFDYIDDFDPQDDLEFKRYAKRFAKLAVYKTLQKILNKSLPWGALTGIRPTKLAYSEIKAGRDFKPLFEKLCVDDENAELIARVIRAQRGLYEEGGTHLYVSLPFCPTKCDYCSFVTAPIERTKGYVDSYIEALKKELESVKPYLKNLQSIYVGGGTPFVLDESQLTRIYAAINEVCDIKCEYTVEAGRPDVFTEEKLALSQKFGVNRICVNPQSFRDQTLRAIGRKHTEEDTVRAFEMSRKFDFDINLDLIAGLADETPEDFENSLNRAVALSPENITVHTLSLKSGAKLKERVAALDIDGIDQMIALSRKLLTAAGYEPYYLYRQKYQAGGLENVGWSKKGKACLYNIGVMEERGSVVAVGANAISKRIFSETDRIERYSSPKDIPSYINKVDEIILKRAELFKDF